MEEVLQNPKATWEEIRLAMKSHGHATNGGAMTTLLFPVTTKEGTSKETGQKGRVVETAAKPGAEGDDNAGSLHHGQLDELLSNNTPMNSDFGYKPCRSRKPATIAPKAGRVGSANSINRAVVTSSSTSITTDLDNASLASVDMMDFGVDHDAVSYSMETLNEIDSRRGTECSITANESSSCLTNGFLDWNHDDDSSANPSQHVGRDESCPDNKSDTHKSEHPSAPEVRRRESWHIEDHDFEPVVKQPVIPKMLHRLSSGTFDTVSSLFSRLSHELGPGTSFPHDGRCDSQEPTTDEVKKALSYSRAKYRRNSSMI
uniref:Uncharacterized protein n=1 Tax=Skeletonema marinoi TaxID=267567 RepID=A0A7S2M1L3_9STRA|mmetsp:Transcript_32626/g.55168  ORF Transcript_32626/g.55168 Transcript_32626/m.55168 type:complete len:316 (+) Transcript_32626:224-1171(+)